MTLSLRRQFPAPAHPNDCLVKTFKQDGFEPRLPQYDNPTSLRQNIFHRAEYCQAEWRHDIGDVECLLTARRCDVFVVEADGCLLCTI